jgi:hypothetical protein
MRYDMPDETYEHRECSDRSTNMSNDMYKSGMCLDDHPETLSDVDNKPDGSDGALVMNEPMNNDMISSKDAVEFRCIPVYHHITVNDDNERESDDGQEPSWDDDHKSESRNGDEPYPNGLYYDEDCHRWMYDVYTSECDDPSNCGSPVEQHWEDRGEEPLPWLEQEDAPNDDDEEDEASDEEEYDDSESSYD